MIFHKTDVVGVLVVDVERMDDDRGFFARTWCEQEAKEAGLNPRLAQCSISYNRHKGTLRGIHYQAHPYPEAKLVRRTQGAIYDVALDLRPESPTFTR